MLRGGGLGITYGFRAPGFRFWVSEIREAVWDCGAWGAFGEVGRYGPRIVILEPGGDSEEEKRPKP